MFTQHPTTSVPSVPIGGGQGGGGWSVPGAVSFVAFVMGAAMAAASVVQIAYEAWHSSLDPAMAEGFLGARDPLFLVSVQLAGQILQLVLIWWLAGVWHSDRSAALGLAPARLTPAQWVGIVSLLFLVKILATAVATQIAPPQVHRELGPFVEIVRSPNAWLLFLATVVLAGLTEELLFRGVLSRTLEGTRLGFWVGAGLASAGFALLHMQYGPAGQLVIFAVGMTLAWIRAWSRSLWPAVVCHSLNNAVALFAMKALG
jgi:membrane protease YdiL (CAAX protease family)